MARYSQQSLHSAFDKLHDFIAVNGDRDEAGRADSLIVLGEYLGLARGEQEDLIDTMTEVLGGANANAMYVSGAYLGYLFCLLVTDYEETDRPHS